MWARGRESATTLCAIAAVLALTTGLAIGTVAFLDEQATRGIRAELDTRVGPDLALRASIAQSANPGKQDREVRDAIAATLSGPRVDADVVRTLAAHVTVLPLDDDADGERGGSAQSIPDFADLVDLVSGAAPVKQTDVAVQADAAAALGLATGDELLLEGVRFTVSGTWRPADPLDPVWYGDPMVQSGFNADFGPFVIDESAWSRIDDNPTVTWTVIPDVSQIDAGNAATLISAWGRIRDDWRPTVSGMESLSPQNRLVQTLKGVQARLDGLRAVEPVVFTLLAAVALVALAVLVRLLVATRRRVTDLYWARGDSRRGIAGRLAGDVAFAAVAGALVGAALSAAAVAALWGIPAVARIGPAAGATTAVTLAGGVLLAIVASRQAAGAGRDVLRSSRRRVRRAALPGVVILVVLAAALSVWQLRLYGSPLTPTISGTGGVDPIAVVAPAMALAALVLLAASGFPRGAALNERRVARGGITAQLAARGVGRRAAVLTAPFVLTALAAGCVTTASAYAATWDVAFTETAALRSGADLHANARLEGIPLAAQRAAAGVAGVTAVAPLEVQPLLLGGGTANLVGVTPAAVADLVTPVPGAVDPAAAAAAITARIPAPVVPADATRVTLTTSAHGFATPPMLTAYLASDLGLLEPVPFDAPVVSGSPSGPQDVTYSAELPAGSGPRTVSALEWTFGDQAFSADPADLHLTSLAATVDATQQDVPLDQFWIPDTPGQPVEYPASDSAGLGFFLFDDATSVRLTPSLDGTAGDRPRPPVLISRQLADRYDLAVGDPLAFNLQDGIERLNCTIAGIIPAIPGSPTESAALLDLGIVQHFQLRTSEIPAAPRDLWITADDPESAAPALQDVLPANTRIESARDPVGRRILGSAALALWAAAGCIVLLALIGVAASAASRLRTGRNDVAVLRALGLTAGQQQRIVAGELRTVLLAGLIVGLAAGAAVALLTIPSFARAAVSAPYLSIGTGLRVDPVGAAVLLVVLVAGAATVVGVTAARVRLLVAHAVPGEASE